MVAAIFLIVTTLPVALFFQKTGQYSPEPDEWRIGTFDLRIDGSNLKVKLLRTPLGWEALLDRDMRQDPLYLNIDKLLKEVYELHSYHLSSLKIMGTTIIENEILSTPIIIEDGPGSTIKNNTLSITNSTYIAAISLVNCSNSIVDNNTIANVVSTGDAVSAIKLIGSNGTVIENNIIRNVSSTSTLIGTSRNVYGIIIDSSPGVKILTNNLTKLAAYDKAYGVYVSSSTGIHCNDTIINDVSSNRFSYGIYHKDSGSAVIKNNTITELSSAAQASGIWLVNSGNSVIVLNNITTVNSTFSTGGIYLQNAGDSVIGNNTIDSLSSSSSSQAYLDLFGIILRMSSGTAIEWNDLSHFNSDLSKARGIVIEDSNSSIIKNNTLTSILSDVKLVHGIFLNKSEFSTVTGNTIDQVESLLSSAHGIYLMESNNAIISWNILTSVDEWLYADETSQDTLYTNNKVNGNMIKLQSFTRPVDLVYEEGTFDNNVTWVASDSQAENYTIYLDGLLNITDTWNDGVPIVHNVDNLTVGSYALRIVLTDTNGQNITDDVVINVIENEPPVIVNPPADVKYVVGTTNHYISWTILDTHPSVYTVYRNGTPDIESEKWTSNVTINVPISGLPLGTHNYTIVAEDTSRNRGLDTVMVHVLLPGIIYLETPMLESIECEYGSSGNILNWTVNCIDNGSYIIYRDGKPVAYGDFSPETPIVYPISGLAVGSYNFSIVVNSAGNIAMDFVTVKVVATPDIFEYNASTLITTPIYTEPPYLTRPPGDPLPGLLTAAMILISFSAGSVWYLRRRMIPEAVKKEEKNLKAARKIDNKGQEGEQLSKIARTYFKRNDFDKAISYHEQALAIFEKLGDKSAQQRELGSLGDIYFEKGRANIEKMASAEEKTVQQRVFRNLREAILKRTREPKEE
ncbi:MAG: right-handed parallel beta-helix repeat-containing protein [Candidatus Odinarchaeota archaeon]